MIVLIKKKVLDKSSYVQEKSKDVLCESDVNQSYRTESLPVLSTKSRNACNLRDRIRGSCVNLPQTETLSHGGTSFLRSSKCQPFYLLLFKGDYGRQGNRNLENVIKYSFHSITCFAFLYFHKLSKTFSEPCRFFFAVLPPTQTWVLLQSDTILLEIKFLLS